MKNKQYVIAKIIYDRNFDIPNWLSNHIDSNTIKELIKLNSINSLNNMHIRYIMEPTVKKFFDTIRYRIYYPLDFISYIMSNGMYDYALLLFGRKDYIKYKVINYKKPIVIFNDISNLICRYGVTNDRYINICKGILNCINIDREKLLRVGILMIKESTIINGKEDLYKQHSYLYRLIKILDVSDDYKLCNICLDNNVPVLFKYPDASDTFKYVECIESSNWKYDIDNDIVDLCMKEFDIGMLPTFKLLAKYNNESLLLQLKSYLKYDYITFCNEVLSSKNNNTTHIKDFKDILYIYDGNVPFDIQKNFILNGDVKTMVGEDGNVLRGVNILSIPIELKYIIDNISIEDLRFLILNCTEFVKCIITSTSLLSHNNMINILKSIFEYPINEELWKILNPIDNPDKDDEEDVEDNVVVDYRQLIINNIIGYMGLDSVFNTVPESMMYITPSVLYITRNINKDNIKYIPIEKLVPYINNIVYRENYIKFNLYCKGKYVSLLKAFSNNKTFITDIIKQEKYGYLCDMTNIDSSKLIDIICNDGGGDVEYI